MNEIGDEMPRRDQLGEFAGRYRAPLTTDARIGRAAA
jgi:hypothetical protein